MSSRPNKGAHRRALGQNFLTDHRLAARIATSLDATPEPVVELGAGSGVITHELAALGRPVTAVEIDPQWTERLCRVPGVHVVRCDMRRFRHPRYPHVVVGNLPYGITTAVTRRLLAEPSWTDAVLLMQWEVARKRASGRSLLNAQWSPWYEFRLMQRVPAAAFQPVPSVDGGLVRISRRHRALVPGDELGEYQRFVKAVFTGRGRGLAEIVRQLCRKQEIPGHSVHVPARLAHALPADLDARDWARVWSEFTATRRQRPVEAASSRRRASAKRAGPRSRRRARPDVGPRQARDRPE